VQSHSEMDCTIALFWGRLDKVSIPDRAGKILTHQKFQQARSSHEQIRVPRILFPKIRTYVHATLSLFFHDPGAATSFSCAPKLSGSASVSSTSLRNLPPNSTGPFASRNCEIRRSTSGRKWRIRPWIGQAAASPRAQIVRPSTCLLGGGQ